MVVVKLVEKTPIGSSFIVFRFECPPGFEAYPGQFVLVQATIDGESFGRHYSISSPYVRETFDITVAVDQDGTVSPWLAQRDLGELVEIQGPYGQNYYKGGYSVVVLAHGPGIGAALGIAERAAVNDTDFSVVFYNPHLVFEHQLSRLAATDRPVIFVKKRVAEAIEVVMNNGTIFVFGFREFIDTVKSVLADHDFDMDTVKFENYG